MGSTAETPTSQMAKDSILEGPFWPGPVRVIRVEPIGATRIKIEAVSLDGEERLITRLLKREDLAQVQTVSTVGQLGFDGDALHFRLAAEATRIRLAYTHDPQFAVSVARIDPLPHQLEAVYYYMLRQPRLRFLLADDPGAGKTIMAGLFLKELKLRRAITRTLIVAPANLAPQWQREMAVKFDEPFDLVDRAALNAWGSRAWEITDQCVVSMDFAWQADVLESLARAQRWDLVFVDEAHKMAAYRRGDKLERTRRYRLGEFLTDHTEHLLLLTATPHKGDPENFRLLLQLLDPDLFADTEILARAVQRQENPIFLRRLKEDMKGFDGQPLFPPRHVKTLGVELTDPEQKLYEDVTRYVADNFNRALAEDNRNVTFALIILQRRLASSVRAIRRSLENRRDRLSILRDEVRANSHLLEVARQSAQGVSFAQSGPQSATTAGLWSSEKSAQGGPQSAATGLWSSGSIDIDELSEDAPEQERWEAEECALRFTVARNLDELEAEIAILDGLATQALAVEESGPERKLNELQRVIEEVGLLRSGEKLLIFTEAKDTLDYLVENLTAWGLTTNHIDGTMAPPERYRAEQVFRDPEGAQVMVATEAAGEGINLQFCHLMINYDLPWNPTRLEQRMGRIHRYGQKYEVYIYNLVATSTREGMVFHALLDKLERMRKGLGQDRVFDVVDQLLEGVPLERLIRDALANRLTFEEVRDQVLARLDPFGDDAQGRQDQESRLQEATLAGLATRYVDLTRLRADRQRAAEERLVPAYIRAFFGQAMEALAPDRLERRDDGFWRIPYVPAALREVPESLRRRYGPPAESYAAITFDKADLDAHRSLTFVGPGRPLFEAVVHHVLDRFGPDLARGAVLRDPAGEVEGLLWLLVGNVEDGLGRIAGRRLFALFQPLDGGELVQVSPARLLDFEPISPASAGPQSSSYQTAPAGSQSSGGGKTALAGPQSSHGGGKTALAGPQSSDGGYKTALAGPQSSDGGYKTALAGPQSSHGGGLLSALSDDGETYHRRLAERDAVVDWSLDHVLDPYLAGLQAQRQQETDIIRDYLQRSFDVLIARSQSKLMEYEQKAQRGMDMALSIQEEQRHLEDLRRRQTSRLAETERAAMLSLSAPEVLGVAAVVKAETPAVTSGSPGEPPMRRSDEVEDAAMVRAVTYEQGRGWEVEDVSAEDRGYDLMSRSPEGEVRYIEVKGRAGVGAVEISENEWLKAEQLGEDYWLYIVTDALESPALYLVQDPAHRLPREEVVPRVRYRVAQQGWHRVAESAVEYKVSPGRKE
jgi:superfamily II DNA or RNA helicase